MEKFIRQYSKIPKTFIKDFFNIAKESYDDDDMVIKFDIVVKWLGVQKNHLARLLFSKFEKNYDYTLTKIKVHNKKRSGANYVNKILLTPDCFKELCMISQTAKAKQVRKYYLTTEKLIKKYHKHIEEKLRGQLGLLKINQKPKIKKLGGIIYIIRALNSNMSVYKIGKTKNIRKRMDNYNSGNANDIEPLFILEVDDVDAVEGCIKNIAKQYQYRKYKEVYETSLNMLQIIAVDCDEFIKGFEKYSEKNSKAEINKRFKKLRTTESGLFFYIAK